VWGACLIFAVQSSCQWLLLTTAQQGSWSAAACCRAALHTLHITVLALIIVFTHVSGVHSLFNTNELSSASSFDRGGVSTKRTTPGAVVLEHKAYGIRCQGLFNKDGCDHTVILIQLSQWGYISGRTPTTRCRPTQLLSVALVIMPTSSASASLPRNHLKEWVLKAFNL
jgi:hypothetical protein